ncbi:MAG: hypothetical protein GY796_33760 [Chloroflexi bacterium]|nr:hypothetical protein [Chloroflexota bacterium]
MIYIVVVLVSLAGLMGCQGAENYNDLSGPLFVGNYAPEQIEDNGCIKIITWNIKFAENVTQALAELESVPELQEVDFLLLQEMDETAVETMAQTLAYNHVYFPASLHPQNGKNFGNAILSKWPLSNPQKLLLPHENPTNAQTRIATKATAAMGGREILLYSVHTETVWLGEEKRLQQVDVIVNDIADENTWVIVGGDFNTVQEDEVTAVTERFATIDLRRVSVGAEPTVKRFGLEFSADHIFARDGTLSDNGVWSDTEASDHYPVWVVLDLGD